MTLLRRALASRSRCYVRRESLFNTATSRIPRSFILDLSDSPQQASSIPLLFTLSHEGENTRFASGVTSFLSALTQGATGDSKTAYLAALASGSELSYGLLTYYKGVTASKLSTTDCGWAPYCMISKPLTNCQSIEAIKTIKKQQYCQSYNSKWKGKMNQETSYGNT